MVFIELNAIDDKFQIYENIGKSLWVGLDMTNNANIGWAKWRQAGVG